MSKIISAFLVCISIGLKLSAQAPYVIPDIPTSELSSGPALYKSLRAQCHGAFMDGGSATGLVKTKWLFGKEKGFLIHNTTHGIEAAGMPAFGKALTPQQINRVIDHVWEKQGTMVRFILRSIGRN